jgi:competence protein ComEC
MQEFLIPEKNFLKDIFYRRMVFIFILFFLSFVFMFFAYNLSDRGKVLISFLDVGQGDSIYIKTSAGGEILIDGGKSGIVLEKLGEQKSILSKKFDLVIATHNDSDHIGGLIYILEKYQVENLLIAQPFEDSENVKKLTEIANEKDVNILQISQRRIIETNDGLRIEILFPIKNVEGLESNDASIVTKIYYGNISFLSIGDLPHFGELFLTKLYGKKLQSTILKLGHHGSDTSSHPYFLEIVSPSLAIISAGKDNQFGHPHKSVLDLLEKFSIPKLSTAEMGTINLETDGISVWQK